jgi:TRAP-type uncharacterized transport system substrate-binding protein
VTADAVFNSLNIPVQRSYYDNDESLKRLMSGDISAMIILTGAPQVTMSKVKTACISFRSIRRACRTTICAICRRTIFPQS